MRVKAIGSVFLVLCFAISSYAQEVLELTLAEAVKNALRENLSMAEERILFKVREAEIKIKEGEFDPALKFELNEYFERSQSATTFISGEERGFTYDVSFGGKIKTGTAYELKLSGAKTEVSETPFLLLNPYYSSELVLSVTQPLLKGFGRSIQESNLQVAKNNLKIAALGIEHRAMDIIARTAGAYWDLYFSKSNLDVAELSLKLAENLLNEVKAKIDAGELAPVEIYKAEAEVAIREEQVLRAKKALSDAEDALRVVMNLNDWQKRIVPVDVPPEPKEIPALETLLGIAFENRRDYKQAFKEYKNKKILRRFYENQKLPELNIVASVGLNGLNGNYGDALDRTASGNYYSWQFGLSLNIPLGNKIAVGNYLRAKYDEEMAEVKIKALRQRIIFQVREALRALRLARDSVKAAEKTRIASEKRPKAEQERFRLGMATLNDVLRFQEDYAKALSAEERAIAEFAKAEVNLKKAIGTLSAQSEALRY